MIHDVTISQPHNLTVMICVDRDPSRLRIPGQEDCKAAEPHSTAMVLAKSESSEELLASNGMDKFLSSTRPRDVLDGVTWQKKQKG